MTTKIEHSATQLAAAANIKNIWGGLIYNVKAYGAIGDGVTDDTLAIQAAIDAAPAGSIIWLNGRFKVSQLSIANRVDLHFTGGGQLIGSGDTILTSFAIIFIENSSRIKVGGLQITGMNSGVSDRGFWINNCFDLDVFENRITNFGTQAFTLYGGSTNENMNVIRENYITGNNYGIKLEVNAEYYHFYNNRISQNNFGLYGGFGNCRVDGNQVNGNVIGMFQDSTLGSNPDHTSISGNQFNHNSQIGLYLANTVNGMQVSDNQMLSTTGGAWIATGKPHSLVMVNVKDITMIGNRIDADGSVSSWIHVDGHTNCRYIGNSFEGGKFKEISAGNNNAFIGNRYLAPSGLLLFASTTDTIRSYEIENGILLGTNASVINKNAATLLNGWINVAGWMPLTYWRDGEGCVHMQGVISTGVGNIMVLPVNYRPLFPLDMCCTANNAGDNAAIRIYPNGDVQPLSGGNTLFSINGMFKP